MYFCEEELLIMVHLTLDLTYISNRSCITMLLSE
jgi:hypothetical protein